MTLSSIQAMPTTPTALPARQLAGPRLIPQTENSFISQFADPLNQPASPPQAAQSQSTEFQTTQANPVALNGQLAHSGSVPASGELREAFQDFVGQTFFAEMIKACRSGQQPSAYFNGGRAEEIFQGQLDQVLSEELSKSSADKIADPMFELFMLKRQS